MESSKEVGDAGSRRVVYASAAPCMHRPTLVAIRSRVHALTKRFVFLAFLTICVTCKRTPPPSLRIEPVTEDASAQTIPRALLHDDGVQDLALRYNSVDKNGNGLLLHTATFDPLP